MAKRILIIAIIILSLVGCRAPAQVATSQTVLPRLIAYNSSAITVDTTWTSYEWYRNSTPYQYADIGYVIRQGGTFNTITLTLQVSGDSSTWYSHSVYPAIVTGSIADNASGTITANVNWPYFRITADVTGTQSVTPTIFVYLR